MVVKYLKPEIACEKLIKSLRLKGISDENVLDAFRKVPRHLFVDGALFEQAYDDNALPIGQGQTISQPFVVALMTQSLKLTKGANEKIVAEILDEAKKARSFILEKMNQIISEPRKDLSVFAPRIFILKIKKDQIGSLIGPGGKVINKIIEDNEVAIDIEEDGKVFVTAPDEKKAQAAIAEIKNITKEFVVGELIKGRVSQIRDFGAIIDLGGTKEGLLHISELAPWHVAKVEDVIHQNEELNLKIKKVEANGKISLSLKDAQHSGDNNRNNDRKEKKYQTRNSHNSQ